jgi:hypothetical protein
MNTSALNEIKQNKKITLLKKADFLSMVDPKFLNEFKKWKIKELRGKFRDMRGYCFSCLTPLKADYTRFENYCLDC